MVTVHNLFAVYTSHLDPLYPSRQKQGRPSFTNLPPLKHFFLSDDFDSFESKSSQIFIQFQPFKKLPSSESGNFSSFF